MRRLFLSGIALGLIFIIAIAVLLVMRGRKSVVVLPNGMQIELLGVTMGGAAFNSEKPWERLARKYLPASATRWIAPRLAGTCSGGSNGITVFVRVTSPGGAPIGGTPWNNYAAEDDAGFRYNPGGSLCGFGGAPGTQIYGLILPAYPRRQKSFMFHLLDVKGAALGTLRVPNPSPGPFSNWQSAALPQTQTNGPVTLTLGAMRASGTRWRFVKPQWHVLAHESRWENAQIGRVWILDATGNQDSWLSPAEDAWKLRATMHRQYPDGFAPAERLVLTNITIPQPGSFVPLDRTLEISGAQFVAHVLAGPGRFVITNNGERGMLPGAGRQHGSMSSGNISSEYWGDSMHFLLLESSNVQPDDRIEIRMRADTGHEIELVDSNTNTRLNRSAQMYQRSFVPPDRAKSLTIEVILNRPLVFEFIVNPSDVRPTADQNTDR